MAQHLSNTTDPRDLGVEKQIDTLDQARHLLRADNPALAVLNTQDLSLSYTSNPQLLSQIQAGFHSVRDHIHTAQQKIRDEDMPLEELGPVIEEAKQALHIYQRPFPAVDILLSEMSTPKSMIKGLIIFVE